MFNDDISRLNSRDDTIAQLNSIKAPLDPESTNSGFVIKQTPPDSCFKQITHGRMRWLEKKVAQFDGDNMTGYDRVKTLQQEVIVMTQDSTNICPTITKEWVDVPTEWE
jgi:hypothetical protein